MFLVLPGDSWRWRHDAVKLCIINICNDSKIRADAEVFGLFRDLIPPELVQEGGELQYGRQRVGLTPDLLLRIPTPDGVTDQLGEVKAMSAGVSRYPSGRVEKQADRRARAGNLPPPLGKVGPGQRDCTRGNWSFGDKAAGVWRAALFGGWSVGRLLHTSA